MTRLMCSKDRNQVEFVKDQLSRAGILAEIRTNPLAAALRVTRLELWLLDERDFPMASNLCLKFQEIIAEPQEVTGMENDAVVIAAEVVPQAPLAISKRDKTVRLREVNPLGAVPKNTGESNELEQASALLEQEIEALLARESDLKQKCESLHGRVKTLTESLSQAQAQIAREAVARELVEKKAAALADAQGALQCELREMHHELQRRDEALAAAKADLQAKLQESRTHDEKVAGLKKELILTHDQLVAETESRLAAEERAAQLTTTQECLEQQLAEQLRLQEQVRACAGNLNSLRNRLQAKNSARPGS